MNRWMLLVAAFFLAGCREEPRHANDEEYIKAAVAELSKDRPGVKLFCVLPDGGSAQLPRCPYLDGLQVMASRTTNENMPTCPVASCRLVVLQLKGASGERGECDLRVDHDGKGGFAIDGSCGGY